MMEILTHPFNNQCFHHIETNQLICTANQLTGFYMRATLPFNGLNMQASSIVLRKLRKKQVEIN